MIQYAYQLHGLVIFMHTLLIADPSDVFISILTEKLSGEYEIIYCHDGETALEMLVQNRPDILILNLMLPFKDGLTLLQESPYHPDIVLGVSTVVTPYISQRACELGVDHLLVSPIPSCVRLCLADLVASKAPALAHNDPQQQVAKLLQLLQLPTHRSGYQCLCALIPMYKKDPGQNLNKELYPAVVEACHLLSIGAAEKSIRRVITAGWKAKDPIVWSRFFDVTKRCPTNLEFIARLAQEIV